MKARLLAVFAACNVILPLMLVSEVEAMSTSIFARRNKDSDAIVEPEENPLFDSPGLNSSPSDANYKKRTKLSPSTLLFDDNDEIMQTAETYFRPLSRYRELQKEKQEKQKKKYDSDNEAAAAAHVPVSTKATNRVYNTKLLSKNPEYCLPVKNGVVCFYKV